MAGQLSGYVLVGVVVAGEAQRINVEGVEGAFTGLGGVVAVVAGKGEGVGVGGKGSVVAALAGDRAGVQWRHGVAEQTVSIAFSGT